MMDSLIKKSNHCVCLTQGFVQSNTLIAGCFIAIVTSSPESNQKVACFFPNIRRRYAVTGVRSGADTCTRTARPPNLFRENVNDKHGLWPQTNLCLVLVGEKHHKTTRVSLDFCCSMRLISATCVG